MKLLTLNSQPTLPDALGIIDTLRNDLESGKLVAFYAVGISRDDQTYGYCGTSRYFSRLRMEGALSNALHNFQHDEETEGAA